MRKSIQVKIGTRLQVVNNPKLISYYEQTKKRTLFQKIIKIKNTVLLIMAYFFPSNGGRILLHKLRGVNIGTGCYIGLFCFIDNLYPNYVYLENYCNINSGSMLIAHFNPRLKFKKLFNPIASPVIIREGAMVAVNCVILPGVEIGNYSIVSASSVVTKNVDSYTIVRGNPASFVRKYKL